MGKRGFQCNWATSVIYSCISAFLIYRRVILTAMGSYIFESSSYKFIQLAFCNVRKKRKVRCYQIHEQCTRVDSVSSRVRKQLNTIQAACWSGARSACPFTLPLHNINFPLHLVEFSFPFSKRESTTAPEICPNL